MLGDQKLARVCHFFFFFNDTATTEIYTLFLHDALPISSNFTLPTTPTLRPKLRSVARRRSEEHTSELQSHHDLVCRLLLEKKKIDNATAKPTTRTNPVIIHAQHKPSRTSYVTKPPAAIAVAAMMPSIFFFFNDTATTEIYTLSLHDALPISACAPQATQKATPGASGCPQLVQRSEEHTSELQSHHDLVCRLLLEKKKKK